MDDIWNCRVMRPSVSCSTQVAMIMSQLTTLIWDSRSLDADAAVVESVSAAAVSSAAGTWRYSQIGPMILRMFQLWMDPFTSLPSKQNELLPTWPLWTRSATHVKEKSSMQSNDCFMLTSSPIPILQIFSAPQSTCGCNVTTSAQKIWSSHLCAPSSSLPVDSYNLYHTSIWHKTLEPLGWILDAGSPGSGCRGLDQMFIAHCNHCHEALNIVRQPNGGSFHYVVFLPTSNHWGADLSWHRQRRGTHETMQLSIDQQIRQDLTKVDPKSLAIPSSNASTLMFKKNQLHKTKLWDHGGKRICWFCGGALCVGQDSFHCSRGGWWLHWGRTHRGLSVSPHAALKRDRSRSSWTWKCVNCMKLQHCMYLLTKNWLKIDWNCGNVWHCMSAGYMCIV